MLFAVRPMCAQDAIFKMSNVSASTDFVWSKKILVLDPGGLLIHHANAR